MKNGLPETFDKNKSADAAKLRLAPRILLAPARLLGNASGNTRDNDEIYTSCAVVKSGAEDIEIVSGRDEIEKAAREGYEFVSVGYVR